jgi:hypothetical protein
MQVEDLKKAWNEAVYGGRALNFHPSQFRDARHDTPLRRDSPDPEFGCEKCTRDHCECLAELTVATAFQGDASAPMDGVSMTDDHSDSKGHEAYETDYTHLFANSASRATALPSLNEETEDIDCNHCKGDPENCFCPDGPSLNPAGNDGSIELSRTKSSSSSDDVKPNLAMTGPGSCVDCQSNPEQRAWCQRVAQLRSEATPPSSRRNSSRGSSLDIMEPKALTRVELNEISSSPTRTVGCSDAFKLLDGRVSTDPNAMDWRNLKPVTQHNFTMEPNKFSAVEFEAGSILTTLQHAQGSLQPRASDGSYARLVEEAEERRRVSSDDHAMLDAVSQYNIQD